MEKHLQPDIFKETVKRKLPEIPDNTDNYDHLWTKVVSEISPAGNDSKTQNYLWYAAAAVLILLSASMGYYFSGDYKDTFLFADNKILEYSLSDGSKVTLNKQSKVVIDHNYEDKRSLNIKGEVYFEVKSNPENPFVVEFDNHRLVVLGTKFNIRSVPDINEITVTEGIVKVYSNGKDGGIILKAGEQLKITDAGDSNVTTVDSENFISWKTGMYQFKDTQLEEVATVLSRRYERIIELNPLIKNCIFTGDLTSAELDEAIKIIAMSTFLKIETTEEHIYLTGPSCD